MNGSSGLGHSGSAMQAATFTLWISSTVQSTFCRLWWWPWAVPCAYGAASTSWKVMAMTTLAQTLMVNKEAVYNKDAY